jgi:drug/metabolite transporter superfamily protein YnfA
MERTELRTENQMHKANSGGLTAGLMRPALLAMLLAWAALEWFALRPDSIVVDWMGWRQADTQQIAVNGLRPEARFNVPEINWGGAAPAAVEAEFQLYTEMITPALRVFGPVEWPGQLISLACVLLAALVFFQWLEEKYSYHSALLGTAALLVSRCPMFLATSVQPDALALLFLVVAWSGFDRWMHAPGWRHWLWAPALALSSLVKPINLQLGLAQFLLVVFTDRRLLLKPSLWAGWLFVLGTCAVQIAHGARIHAETGLTFGVISLDLGGDNKFAALGDFYHFGNYWLLFKAVMGWGMGPIGLLAIFWLLLRRALPKWAWALGISHLVLLLAVMTYTTNPHFGSHYHTLGGFLAALAVACAINLEHQDHSDSKRSRVVMMATVAAVLATGAWNMWARLTLDRQPFQRSIYNLAETLKPKIPPGTPVIVRTDGDNYVRTWRLVPHVYQDPRLLYLLNTPGWVVWATHDKPEDLSRFTDAGARWYLEPADLRASGGDLAWLTANAMLVVDSADGRAWRLNTAAR